MKIIKFHKPVYFANIIEDQMTENGIDSEWQAEFDLIWNIVGLHDHLVATQIYAELL